jgi:hypothetical protein
MAKISSQILPKTNICFGSKNGADQSEPSACEGGAGTEGFDGSTVGVGVPYEEPPPLYRAQQRNHCLLRDQSDALPYKRAVLVVQ